MTDISPGTRLAARALRGSFALLGGVAKELRFVAVTAGVDPRNAGVASGLMNTCRQTGAALGLAALVTVAGTVTRHTHSPGPAPVVHGYHTALLVTAAVSLATTLISLLLNLPRTPTTEAPLHPATSSTL